MADQILSRTDREILRLLMRASDNWQPLPISVHIAKKKRHELEDKGLVEWRQIGTRPFEYHLTEAGKACAPKSSKPRPPQTSESLPP